MDMKLFALGLALPGLGALAAASPTTPSPIAFPAGSTVEVASAKPESSEFGQPLFVNGQRVTDNDIKRFLIYGPCRLMLEMYRVSLIIEDEIVRRCREAADAAIEPEVGKRAKTVVEAALQGKTFESPEARQKVADAETTKARTFCASCHGVTTAVLPQRLAFDDPFSPGLHRALRAGPRVSDLRARLPMARWRAAI